MNTTPAKRQMILGMHLGTGYGSQANAWRAPGVNPAAYADIEAQVRYARAAERGTFDFLFLPDNLAITPSMGGEVSPRPPWIRWLPSPPWPARPPGSASWPPAPPPSTSPTTSPASTRPSM